MWYFWDPSNPLTITFDQAINSLWFPTLSAAITITCNGLAIPFVTPATGKSLVPLPLNTTTVVLSASGSIAMPVYATSAILSPE
jgi:hypothetical protein